MTAITRSWTRPLRRSRCAAIFLGLLLSAAAAGAHAETGSAVGSPQSVRASAARGEVDGLNALARDLVARAGSNRADAVQFRIDATVYRESLRRRMLSQSSDAADHADRELHAAMVRMAALLNAAAECKTGRYITCPAELMLQLTTQQQRIEAMLEARADRG